MIKVHEIQSLNHLYLWASYQRFELTQKCLEKMAEIVSESETYHPDVCNYRSIPTLQYFAFTYFIKINVLFISVN